MQRGSDVVIVWRKPSTLVLLYSDSQDAFHVEGIEDFVHRSRIETRSDYRVITTGDREKIDRTYAHLCATLTHRRKQKGL